MAEKGSYELAEDLARAKRELTKHAERERRRTARELGIFMRHLRGLERSLLAAAEELGRIDRTIPKLTATAADAATAGDLATADEVEGGDERDATEKAAKEPRLPRPRRGDDETVPDGTVLIATRLAAEGHSRADVQAFLEENFDNIDAAATVDALFEEAAEAEPTEA